MVSGNNRENLAQRHPCYPINKRLEPYIKWTERLVSSQYKGKSSFFRYRTYFQGNPMNMLIAKASFL